MLGLGLTGLQAQTVQDIDGNVYKTVTIDAQVWMAGNLKTTRYNDGTAIPFVTNDTTWSEVVTPAYCWYDNDTLTNKNTYGALYNWYTVSTAKLCPTGWHIPSDTEWTVLIEFLGGTLVAGGLLMETGTTHWPSPNIFATNESGFTALPGGSCIGGYCFGIGDNGSWWSSTELDFSEAYFNELSHYLGSQVSGSAVNKGNFYSVRCIRE
ncbi:MAG: fibrobacter succinogenes major paralogous domain-containing protein [Bacteroidales bacterium]|nr:fibrobacter succinogenes major paralogous domain-containing protein [Bacteroidales bacterium]